MTSALAHAPLPMAVFRGPQLDCVTASEPWRRMFGPKPPSKLHEHLGRVQRTQRASNVTLQTATRRLRIMMRPVPDQEVLATCIDCTELHRARAEVERVRRFKEQALSAVSHELRGPISTILLWERILRNPAEQVDARERALDAIRESATMQSNMIAELVDVSSVIGGATDLHCTRVDIESLLCGVIEVTSRARPTAFTTDLRPPLGCLRADAERLRQALAKVIDTAARVAPSESAVPIAARRERGHTVIWIGQRPRSRRPDRILRLELGLVLASELIALHGGALEAMRYARGHVPTFSISLPTVLTPRT
jgi:K+-sensing histidine kinase KdpD